MNGIRGPRRQFLLIEPNGRRITFTATPVTHPDPLDADTHTMTFEGIEDWRTSSDGEVLPPGRELDT